MKNNVVAVSKCEGYKSTDIRRSLDQLLQVFKGLNSFVKPGDRVVIKPNMLLGKEADQAVTTHPMLIKELINKLKEIDCEIIIGDSPGGPFNKYRLENIYKKTGFLRLAEKEDIKLNYNTESTKIALEDGFIVKSFEIANFIKDADVIINMPKLKTHSFMKYTGAVKNNFGCIPGMKKAEYHLRMPEAENFALMLIDLARLINPQLNIMDAVYGMEGAGPSAGEKRKFGYLLASTSCFALDIAGSYLFNIEPKKVPTINQASQKGIIGSFDQLKIYGDKIIAANKTKVPKINKTNTRNVNDLPLFLAKIVNKLLKPRPVFNKKRCVKCGDCAANCPVEAIELSDYPKVDLDECIRCFCCQELCSYQAVEIKKPLLGKIFFR